MPSDARGIHGHAMVVTGARKNGNVLHVRCTCMAEYPIRGKASTRYYNYDYLAEVTSLGEAKRAYRSHLEQSLDRAS